MFDELFKAFESADEELYLVGGAVRDLILGIESSDYDFATSALPEKTIEILEKNKLKVIPIGIEFGTIQTIVNGMKIEITTFRCDESYTKGSRKPAVKFGKTIEEDLRRRDFSINAIAMRKDGSFIDPFNGKNDLIKGELWTPLSPEISFQDDPLRMIRACRFHGKGIASLSQSVAKAMGKLAYKIHDISSERIFEEVSKILMVDKPSRGLFAMVSTGLMKEVFPEIQELVEFKNDQGKWHSKNVWEHTLGVIDNTPPISEIRWAALFHDVGKPQTYSETESGIHFYQHDWKGQLIWDRVARRLRVSNEFQAHVGQLIFEHLQPSQLSSRGAHHVTDKALRRLAHRVGDRLDNLFYLSLADITSHRPDIVEEKKGNCLALKERIDKIIETGDVIRLKLPKGTGLVVTEALGIKPGPELGVLMKSLHKMLIDGDISLDSDFGEVAKRMWIGDE